MFQDVVSNLSLSPAASGQLSFYWRRLKREQLTRTLSFVMAGALVVLQAFTIVAPADAANNCSSNDIIRCGIFKQNHPQKTLLAIYDTDPEIRAIFTHYGISRADIDKTSNGRLNSSNHKLLSLGRNPNNSAYDKPVTIGSHHYYLRPLWTWGDNVGYPALEGRRHGDNKYFAILYGCGNLVLTDTTPSKEVPVVTKIEKQKTTGDEVQKPKPKKPTTTPTTTTTTSKPTDFGTVSRPPETTITTPPPTPRTPTPTGTATTAPKKSGVIIGLDGSRRDANGATAQAGETIEYTLTTTNSGTAEANDYVVSDNINDTLEYADLIDPRGGVLSGGQLEWPKTDITAGASYLASYVVRVKNPLPTTPASTSDPKSFDLVMDNVYGNLVSTHLAAPTAAKAVEMATTTLPQTGPATTTLVVLVLASAIAYFYFRNRQLVTEVAMLRGDHYGGQQ